MGRRRLVVVLSLASITALSLVLAQAQFGERRGGQASSPSPAKYPAAARPPPAGAMPAPAQDPYLALEQGDLRGTRADGSIQVGADGRLQPDLGLRRFFDYYLSLIGETDLKGIHRLLSDELARRRLSPQVAAEVLANFDKYVRLQQSMGDLNDQAQHDPVAQLAALQRLREQILGPVLAQAFYADQLRSEQALARRLAIAGDQTLSAAEKRRRLAALKDDVAIGDKAAQQRWMAADETEALNRRLDDMHADADTRYQLRSAEWGADTADRMAALDQRRAEWQQRLDDFRQADGAIRDDPGLSEAEKQAQRAALLQSRFSGAEQGRVRALLGSG